MLLDIAFISKANKPLTDQGLEDIQRQLSRILYERSPHHLSMILKPTKPDILYEKVTFPCHTVVISITTLHNILKPKLY